MDRIVLVNDGTILADLTPDELLSTNLLRDNGIREPLYITACVMQELILQRKRSQLMPIQLC